ncbi:MAG: TetR/AcrR family transcriptional regulator [Actinomycetota bacterium]
MYRRQRATTPATDVHPTRARILDAAVAVLNDDGFDRFSVQRVLERAEVSRATLYNHYADVDTLIEAALAATFGQELRQNRDALSRLVETAPDLIGFRAAFRTFVDALGRIPATVRFRRTHTLALTANRPALAAAISAAQDEITAAYEAAIRDAQARGFIRTEFDPHTLAVLVQSLGIGRIVDDTSTDSIGNERWAEMYFDVIDRIALVPAP